MLITRPARRNSPTEEKLCDRDINMPLNSPHELNDSREAKDRFKWRIDEKASPNNSSEDKVASEEA